MKPTIFKLVKEETKIHANIQGKAPDLCALIASAMMDDTEVANIVKLAVKGYDFLNQTIKMEK